MVVAVGISLWTKAENGVIIQNWVAPSHPIPRGGSMWTWGVGGTSKSEPAAWHFQVLFDANASADVSLLWNLNESVLFERRSSHIDETFELSLPRTSNPWRWDWLVRNEQGSGLRVENFTVTHYPVSFPERQNGAIAIGTGTSIIIAAIVTLAISRRRDTRQRRPR